MLMYVLFPISDHVMFSWEFSFCVFTSYACIAPCIRLFPRVASRGVKWENKTSKLKRFIGIFIPSSQKCVKSTGLLLLLVSRLSLPTPCYLTLLQSGRVNP